MTLPLHVLMIEDYESDAELAINHLNKAGFAVTSQRVEKAETMQAALNESDWDVIICDYSLPSFSASAALQALQDSGKDIPFIVVSGTISEETAIDLMRTGAADFLMKDRLSRLGPLVRRELNIAQVRKERKQIEEQLRQSEEKFSTAFRVSPDSVNINRLMDGLYLEINEGFKALTGFTEEDVAGKTSLEINIWANPSDRIRLVQGLREQGVVNNLEAPFRCKDGSIKICLMSARVIEINGEKCILSITRDITDRKLKDEEYTTIIQSAYDGFLSMDTSGRFLDVNDALCQLLGFTRQEFIGMHLSQIEFIENPADIAVHIQNVVRTGSDHFQTRLRRKDGATVDVEVNPQYIPLGKRIYVFIHNISERKQAEDKLNDQLEELRRWHAITLGREKRILELKCEVNQLLQNAGLPPRYASVQESTFK